jgi:hypothetical protein
MSLSTLEACRSALKQQVNISKAVRLGQVAVTINASCWEDLWYSGSGSYAGADPASAGAASVGDTTSGVVPDGTTTGAASASFGATGYLTAVRAFGTLQSGRFIIYDRLWHAGTFTANSGTTTLSSQPSFSARLPTIGGNPDYTGLQLWLTSNTDQGGGTWTVTYTNQDGTAGQSTSRGSDNAATGDIGVAQQVPLASGDVGIQKIESVSNTTVGGTPVNVVVVRPLAWGWTQASDREAITPLEVIGNPIVFSNSAFGVFWYFGSGGAVTPIVNFSLEITSG